MGRIEGVALLEVGVLLETASEDTKDNTFQANSLLRACGPKHKLLATICYS